MSGGPIPFPAGRQSFAELVAAESWRLAIEEPDELATDPPITLVAPDDRLTARQATHRRQRLNDDLQVAGRLLELLAPAAPVSLDTEGIAQRLPIQRDRFSQQTAGALALAPRPSTRSARSDSPTDHAGHACCRDQTRPWAAKALIGRRPEAERDGELGVIVLELRCRSWRCPCCKFRLRRRNRARALKGALKGGSVTWFVTITIDPRHPRWLTHLAAVTVPGYSQLLVREAGGRLLRGHQALARASIPYGSASWNRLRTSLDRAFGGRLQYYRAVELHQSGMAHQHLLMRTGSRADWFMHYGRFRALLARAGFGPVTDVQLIASPQKAARYVTKMTAGYTSKNAELMPRWSRRGVWSREWCEWTAPTQIAGFTWEYSRSPAGAVAAGFEADGWQLLDPGAFRIRPAPD